MPELSASHLDRYSRDLVARVLERLFVPFLLLERDGKIAYANGLCEAVLGDGRHMLRGRDGRIAFRSRDASDQSRSFLDRSHEGAVDIDLILAPASSGPPLLAVLSWVTLPVLDEFPAGLPLAVLFIRNGGEIGAIDAAQAMYGLSKTEGQVVRAIVDGQSLADHAAERGVSIHTVRKQLANAMKKTRTKRQGELVRLANRLGDRA